MAAKTVQVISILLGLMSCSSACLNRIPHNFNCSQIKVDSCPDGIGSGSNITIQVTNLCGDPPYSVQDNTNYRIKYTFTPTQTCIQGFVVAGVTYANSTALGCLIVPFVPVGAQFTLPIPGGFIAGVRTSGTIVVTIPPVYGLVASATLQVRVYCLGLLSLQTHVCVQQTQSITMGSVIC